MKVIDELPAIVPIFPLSNFIIFPKATVPLNIFEPRYIEMINDSMKKHKMIGLIQPKKSKIKLIPDLYNVGCLGKITNLKTSSDGRYLIELTGLSRFKVVEEINNNKAYREFKIDFKNFKEDTNLNTEQVKFLGLDTILKGLKTLFEKRGYIIDWKSLEKENLGETINALSMASPFSLEEKQILLESQNLGVRKDKIAEILNTYAFDNFNNTTLQ